MGVHAPVSEVVRYLMWLAANQRPDEPMFLTHLQLEKMLFYIQGWSLVEWGTPIFDAPLRAWQHGAVVEAVHQQFKKYGKRRITDVPEEEPDELIPSDKVIIMAVWNRYKKYSPWGLADLVHEDEAWLATRGDLKQSQPGRKRIHSDLLRRSFNKKFDAMNERLLQKWDRLKDAAKANTQRLTGKPAIGG